MKLGRSAEIMPILVEGLRVFVPIFVPACLRNLLGRVLLAWPSRPFVVASLKERGESICLVGGAVVEMDAPVPPRPVLFAGERRPRAQFYSVVKGSPSAAVLTRFPQTDVGVTVSGGVAGTLQWVPRRNLAQAVLYEPRALEGRE